MQDISKVLETAFHTGCTMSLDLCDRKANADHYNYVEALKVARDAAYTGNWALANEMFTFATGASAKPWATSLHITGTATTHNQPAALRGGHLPRRRTTMAKQFDLFAQSLHTVEMDNIEDRAYSAAQHDMIHEGAKPGDFRAQANTYIRMASQWVTSSTTATTASSKVHMLEAAAQHTAVASGIIQAADRYDRIKEYEDAQ